MPILAHLDTVELLVAHLDTVEVLVASFSLCAGLMHGR